MSEQDAKIKQATLEYSFDIQYDQSGKGVEMVPDSYQGFLKDQRVPTFTQGITTVERDD